MHAISSYRGIRPTHRHTNAQTHKHIQDRLQYTAPQLSAQCNNTNVYASTSSDNSELNRRWWAALTTAVYVKASFPVVMAELAREGAETKVKLIACQSVTRGGFRPSGAAKCATQALNTSRRGIIGLIRQVERRGLSGKGC